MPTFCTCLNFYSYSPFQVRLQKEAKYDMVTLVIPLGFIVEGDVLGAIRNLGFIVEGDMLGAIRNLRYSDHNLIDLKKFWSHNYLDT
jgi:hypothetical protein